jgi:hypothetical protein
MTSLDIRKALVVCCFGISFLVSIAYADVTIKSFKEAKAKGGSDWLSVQLFVFGAGEAYTYTNGALSVKHQPELYSQPDHLSLTTDNFMTIVEKELVRRKYVPSEDLPIVVVLLSGLQYTFPCKS